MLPATLAAPAAASRIRKLFASALIVGYLGVTAVFFGLYAIGDRSVHPAAYFFTWDMFPFFYQESCRRVAVGKTAAGRYLKVYPDASQQYRGGVYGDMTRADLDRGGDCFRTLVDATLRRTVAAESADPVVHVYLLEQFWPEKFNLPDDLYEAWWGEPKPARRYWRLRAEFDVAAPDASDGKGVL